MVLNIKLHVVVYQNGGFQLFRVDNQVLATLIEIGRIMIMTGSAHLGIVMMSSGRDRSVNVSFNINCCI